MTSFAGLTNIEATRYPILNAKAFHKRFSNGRWSLIYYRQHELETGIDVITHLPSCHMNTINRPIAVC
jgi:hypothetical protein